MQDAKVLNNCSSDSDFGSVGLNFYPNQLLSSVFSLPVLEKSQFSLDLNYGNSSRLIFGEFGRNLSEEVKLGSSSLLKSWGFHSRGFKFGSAFSTKSFSVALDSTESFIVGPKPVISQIFSSLLEKVSCRVSDFKFIYCPCDEVGNSPQLIFYVHKGSVAVSPENLFEVVGEECRFVVTYHSNNTWVLGYQFFYEYILTFNLEYRIIDLQMKKKTEEQEELPVLNSDEIWITVFTVFGCFLFYVLVRIFYVVYGWVSGKFVRSDEELQEPLVENLDSVEISKFRARRNEMLNRLKL